MNRHFLGKNLDAFPQNSKLFSQILVIKNRYHFKLILGHAAFQLLSESIFSLKFSLLLNNFIS